MLFDWRQVKFFPARLDTGLETVRGRALGGVSLEVPEDGVVQDLFESKPVHLQFLQHALDQEHQLLADPALPKFIRAEVVVDYAVHLVDSEV